MHEKKSFSIVYFDSMGHLPWCLQGCTARCLPHSLHVACIHVGIPVRSRVVCLSPTELPNVCWRGGIDAIGVCGNRRRRETPRNSTEITFWIPCLYWLYAAAFVHLFRIEWSWSEISVHQNLEGPKKRSSAKSCPDSRPVRNKKSVQA